MKRTHAFRMGLMVAAALPISVSAGPSGLVRTPPAAGRPAPEAQGGEFNGMKLPMPDAKVSRLFTRPDGGLVIGFTYRSKGQLYSGFYDVRANKRLSQDLEYEMAHNNKPQFEVIKSNNLKAIDSLNQEVGAGVSVEGYNGGNNEGCRFPYYPTLVFRKNHDQISSITVLIRHPQAQVHVFGCPYEESAPPKPARLRFQSMVSVLHSDGKQGFYASDGPYVIHFDRNGHSQFFAGRIDIVALPSQRLDEIASEAEGSNARSWQPYVDRAEKIVEQAVTDQGGHTVKP